MITSVSVNGTIISTTEAAAILNLSERRIRQLADDGYITAQQFAGVWAINKASLMKFEAKRKAKGKRSK